MMFARGILFHRCAAHAAPHRQGCRATAGRLTVAWALASGAMACMAAPPAEVVRFSVVEGWSQPFLEFKGDVLVSGIVKDLGDVLAAELKLQPQFIVHPRKRVDAAVERMEVDVLCFCSPAWIKDPSLYLWSGTLFRIQEIIVHRSDVPVPTDMAALRGKNIGVILGFQNYDFDAYIRDGSVQTAVALGFDQLARMLTSNRIQYAAMNSLTYAYYLKNPEFAKVMATTTLTTSESLVECAFSKKSRVPPEKLVAAAEVLRKSGAFEKILAKYR